MGELYARVRGSLPVAGVFAVGFVARLLYVATSSGGLRGFMGYDPSVYYSAADALIGGRMPYRDFTLLHPPAMMLGLTPFAALGRLTTDHTGFVAADLAVMALGALNAVLVFRLGRRLGLDTRAATAAALFYAVWAGAVGAEYLTLLEPLGNFFVLLGLLAQYSGRPGDRRPAVLSGLAFGAAASTKIWWGAPLLLVGAWQLRTRRPADLLRFVAGAAAAVLVIDGPFLLLAPRQMWQMVIVDQLGRERDHATLAYRLGTITGLDRVVPHLTSAGTVVVLAVACALFAAVLVRAWRVPPARFLVGLALAQVAVLLAAPSCFPHYADFLAPATAASVGAAVSRAAARGRAPLRWTGWCATAAAAVVTFGTIAVGQTHASRPFPSGRLAAAVRSTRCVMSDSPMALILLDVLSRDLRNGCPDWVDVTGRTYGADADRRPNGTWYPRRANRRWQRDLLRYLDSGGAVILVRRDTGASQRTRVELHEGGLLARVGDRAIYRTGPVIRRDAGRAIRRPALAPQTSRRDAHRAPCRTSHRRRCARSARSGA